MVKPILVAVLCKMWVCGCLIAGIARSNPAECMDVRFLCLLCVVRWLPLRRADHSFRGVLSVVCVSVCDLET
jgi:hypothetical protein